MHFLRFNAALITALVSFTAVFAQSSHEFLRLLDVSTRNEAVDAPPFHDHDPDVEKILKEMGAKPRETWDESTTVPTDAPPEQHINSPGPHEVPGNPKQNETVATSSCPSNSCPDDRDRAIRALLETLSTIVTPTVVKLENVGTVYNSRCLNFIKSDGSLGPWGIILNNAIYDVSPQCILHDLDVNSICPNYSLFTEEKKILFFAFAFASLAQDESSCNPEAKVQTIWSDKRGRFKVGEGLLMMEHLREDRADAGRNKHWCKTDEKYNTKDITFQLQCSISIINDQYCSSDPPKPITHPNGYWEKLNSKDGKNQKVAVMIKGGTIRVDGRAVQVKGFPGCSD